MAHANFDSCFSTALGAIYVNVFKLEQWYKNQNVYNKKYTLISQVNICPYS